MSRAVFHIDLVFNYIVTYDMEFDAKMPGPTLLKSFLANLISPWISDLTGTTNLKDEALQI